MKMQKKKHWVSITYYENSDAKKSDETNISWSNSDSDDSNKDDSAKKKPKLNNEVLRERKNNTWISTIVPNQNITPTKRTNSLTIETECLCENDENYIESPVIGRLKFEPESPVLSQTPLYSPSPGKQSPILNRRKILKKIKLRHRPERDKPVTPIIQDESSTSEDLFISQTSNIAINSQKSPARATQVEISQTKSEVSQSCNIIDPFPSQNGSQIIDSGSSYFDVQSLYHEPPPRKKRFKKGGLASQLRKAMEIQSASLAIWQHEVFLSKSKGEEIQSSIDDGVEFVVIAKWEEYGCAILECKVDVKEDALVPCPINPHHRIPPKAWHKHIEKCIVKLEGYDAKDQFLSEPVDNSPQSIHLDRNKKIEIITKELAERGALRLAWNGLDPDPRTSDRLVSTFSPDERLAFYNFSVENTSGPPPPPEFTTLHNKKTDEEKPLSYEELLAQERDAKRRRAKYRSVHINKKNHTEVIREVINGQMEEYKEWLLAKEQKSVDVCNRNNGVSEDKKEEQERPHSSISKNSNRSSSSRSTSRKYDRHRDRRETSRDRYYRSKDRDRRHRSDERHKMSPHRNLEHRNNNSETRRSLRDRTDKRSRRDDYKKRH